MFDIESRRVAYLGGHVGDGMMGWAGCMGSGPEGSKDGRNDDGVGGEGGEDCGQIAKTEIEFVCTSSQM